MNPHRPHRAATVAAHFRYALRRTGAASLLALAGVLAAPVHGQTQVALTTHNLTASGPGSVRSNVSTGTCVFCHTPHNAAATRALWNRAMPAATYTLYASSTTRATLNQPTGSSRLCLSCHDGILALETLRVPPKGTPLPAMGPLKGRTVVGTDLSDDHPISFVYDSALAVARGDLADPLGLPASVHLDDTHQLQCTTCHDPHENRRPNFLRADDTNGALCLSCHRIAAWPGATHATSGATWSGSGTKPFPAGAAAASTVAQNACQGCHRPHAAGHAARLLAQADESANCTVCHNASVASKDLTGEFLKPSHHPIDTTPWVHDPGENPLVMPRHVACADCHNPHAANSTSAVAPAASGRLKGATSVTITGLVIPDPSFEYETCSKCHGLSEPTTVGISRVDSTRNIRLRIAPGNASFHPIAAPGLNSTIVGLLPGYTNASQIGCSGCHNNDAWTQAGTAPAGPHGSLYSPILERQYLANDPTPYAPADYDLCFKCHDQATLMNPGNTFHHNTHVITNNTPCAACHDAHGSRQNAHLIDFMLRDRTGAVVVAPVTGAVAPQYTPSSPGHGRCDLVCHGSSHVARTY